MLIDYHMHTKLTDGSGEPVDYAAFAERNRISEIGFSEHAPLQDRTYDWTLTNSNLGNYVELVEQARWRYPDLNIKLGLEVDYIPGCESWVIKLSQMYPWDYFLGSVHFIDDWPVDASSKDWAGKDVDATWRRYFELWVEMANTGLYDSLAHPDLPKKFNYRPDTDYCEIYEEVLQVVAKSNIAIEVSTAGIRKPCREIYPSPDFLKIANRLNIPVTLGSDAHIPDDVGQDFDKAVSLLRRCGYEQISQFTQRKRKLVDLG